MGKRVAFLVAASVVTVAVAILLIPSDMWGPVSVAALSLVVVAEGVTVLAPELIGQPTRAMSAWNFGMSAATVGYLAAAVVLFLLATAGVDWRFVVSGELLALLGFGGTVATIRSAGRRVAGSDQIERGVYDEMLALRARAGRTLDRVKSLPAPDPQLEREIAAYVDRLRYLPPGAGGAANSVVVALLESVQSLESSVERLWSGEDRERTLAEIRSQLRTSESVMRNRAAITGTEMPSIGASRG